MIEQLSYDTQIDLRTAIDKLEEVETEFKRIRGKYSGILSQFYTNMAKKDLEDITALYGVLLPIGQQKVVQEEFRNAHSEEQNRTMLVRSSQLMHDTSTYLARFKNSGVTVIQGGSIF